MQKIKKNFSIIFLIIIFLVFAVNFSYAQTKPKSPQPPKIPKDPNAPIKEADDIINFFGGILKYIAIVFWILTVAAVFYSGYLYLLSGGNEEKTGKAKRMLLYAVIAIAIGLMAYGFPTLVKSFLEIR